MFADWILHMSSCKMREDLLGNLAKRGAPEGRKRGCKAVLGLLLDGNNYKMKIRKEEGVRP